ncbi:hypothetical protein OMAG_001224 [Candidatus Omnitrophus magneticus]|uniref:Uncharacterized protein n=1 Tax=Candidatus Omnitrophus magneticus TaxID=1609969 RepID=A0A0F0CNS0_9BACT|nr:hypothetical protein OMAG_001224 [Candidatus Omnitrophus magneticus]
MLLKNHLKPFSDSPKIFYDMVLFNRREGMNKFLLNLVIIITGVFVFAVSGETKTVYLKAETSGVYEAGEFIEGNDKYEAACEVNEANENVTIVEVYHSDRDGMIEQGDVNIPYEITNSVVSKGPSGLIIQRKYKDQNILTAVREAGLGATEVLILGETFYEFSRAANGRFYLEYGSVRSTRE